MKRACAHGPRELAERDPLAPARIEVLSCLIQPVVHSVTVMVSAAEFYPDFAPRTYLREVRGSSPVRAATAA